MFGGLLRAIVDQCRANYCVHLYSSAHAREQRAAKNNVVRAKCIHGRECDDIQSQVIAVAVTAADLCETTTSILANHCLQISDMSAYSSSASSASAFLIQKPQNAKKR